MPSSSATIWANVVSWPWPWVCALMLTTALPDGCTRRSAPSFIARPRMSMCLRGPAPTPSVKNETPMPISSPRARFSRLLAAQLLVAGDVHRHLHRLGVVAGVVRPAGRRLVRELLGRDEAAHAQVDRVDLHLQRERVDHPLDQVDGLGDAERAAVGDAARRLVRVDGLDLHVRGLQVVGAAADVEEAGRELGRLGGRVERAVVGDHVDPQAGDLAVLRADLARASRSRGRSRSTSGSRCGSRPT